MRYSVTGRIPKIENTVPAPAQHIQAKLNVRHVVFFFIAICLSLSVVAIWGSLTSRQYRLDDKEIAMSNLAQTLSSQVQASIKQADTVLFNLVDRLEIDGMDKDQSSKLQRLLASQRAELAQLHGLFIYDEKGGWVADSNGVMPLNANRYDGDYYIFHRKHPERGPRIGPSIKSRTTGDWVIPVSRRINHPDGSFAGVVVATLYLDHFLQLYNSIDIGNNGVINLISADAKIVVRRPFNKTEIGTSVANGPLFTQFLPKEPFGSSIVKSYVDGVERVVGFRQVDEYPLIIFVAFDKDEVLANWRQESLLTTLIVAVLMGFLAVIGYRLITLMKHQNHIQSELLDAQEKLIESNQALELLALEDALTGLANRRKFDLFLHSEVGRAKRTQGNLALLMIDVDHFKRFNDQYGHLAGDKCLGIISAIIKENIKRPDDVAARYGGEEFAVVLSGVDYVGAFLVAENIRGAVLQAGIEHSESIEGTVTVSVGVCGWSPSSQDSPDDLVRAADKALYAAKISGRNMSIIANLPSATR